MCHGILSQNTNDQGWFIIIKTKLTTKKETRVLKKGSIKKKECKKKSV
jgi:hypothetical protein